MAKLDELSEGERTFLSAILDQMGLLDSAEESLSAQMSAAHLLVSALEGERKQ